VFDVDDFLRIKFSSFDGVRYFQIIDASMN
jgi:hypothetical protein